MSRTHLIPCAAATLALSLLGALSPAGTASASSAATGATQAQAPRPTCDGRVATIVGTPGDDRIRGTRRGDVIVTRAGDDIVHGFAGNDTICGNVGADALYGGAGSDFLLGGRNHAAISDPNIVDHWADILQGGPGNDRIDPGPHSDRHLPDIVSFHNAKRGVTVGLPRGRATGQGRDRIRVRQGIAVLGSKHDDVIKGSRQDEILMGSRGSDRVYGGRGSDTVHGGAWWMKGLGYGWALREAPWDKDFLAGGPMRDKLKGTGADIVIGGGGNDHQHGGHVQRAGSGNDRLYGHIGENTRGRVIAGGVGRDKIRFQIGRGLGGLETNLRSGVAKLVGTGAEFRFASIEDLFLDNRRARWTVHGTAKGERFRSGGPVRVHAGGGPDWIDSATFNDFVNGGPGRDAARTGRGNDTCVSVEQIRNRSCHAPR